MGKVKMSDVYSGSKNVKELFKQPMVSRTERFLKSTQYTNDELLEILDISERIENHKDKRIMYQRIISSQTGPFSKAVFVEYKDKLFSSASLKNLIKYSEDINDIDKCRWITYAILTSYTTFVYDYFMNGESKEVGINPMIKPFNMQIALDMVQYSDKMKGVVVNSYNGRNFLFELLDTFSETEQYNWYLEVVASTYANKAMTIITSYPNISSRIIEHYYNKADFSNAKILAKLDNCPIDIKMDFYEKTGDEEFLPKEAKDIFLF